MIVMNGEFTSAADGGLSGARTLGLAAVAGVAAGLDIVIAFAAGRDVVVGAASVTPTKSKKNIMKCCMTEVRYQRKEISKYFSLKIWQCNSGRDVKSSPSNRKTSFLKRRSSVYTA